MMTDDEIRSAYQLAHEGESAEACLTEEQLVRAATGEASGPDRQRVADHLIACGRCAEEYRLLTSLRPWAEESAAIVEPAAARAVAVAQTPSRWLMYAMAASVVLSFGVGSWVGTRWWRNADSSGVVSEKTVPQAESGGQLADARRQVEELRRRTEDQQREIAGLQRARQTTETPEPNVPVVDLEAADAFRGPQDQPKTIELPSGVGHVTFVVNPAQTPAAGEYQIDMVGAQRQVIWTSSGLQLSADKTFTVVVPRALVPPGEAHLRLYSQRNGQRKLIEDYAVRVAYK